MLDLLRDGPMTTGDLATHFPKHSRFAVMQHLRMLEKATLVIPHREGRTRLNYLNPVPIQRIFHRWVSKYQEPWAESLVSMKATLEAEHSRTKAR